MIEQEMSKVKNVILGCTHYGLMKEELKANWGKKIEIYSQDEFVPEKLKTHLGNYPKINSKLNRPKEGGERNIFFTKFNQDYISFTESVLSQG